MRTTRESGSWVYGTGGRSLAALLAAGAVSVGGCAERAGPGSAVPDPGGEPLILLEPYPFAAAALEVFPLTRVERDEDDELRIVVYFRLLDRWGDAIKAPGTLQIQLFRSGEGGVGPAATRWEADLLDPGENSRVFDPATRMYRLPLGGAPAWSVNLLSGSGGAETGRVRVVYRTPGPDGAPMALIDDYLLEP